MKVEVKLEEGDVRRKEGGEGGITGRGGGKGSRTHP